MPDKYPVYMVICRLFDRPRYCKGLSSHVFENSIRVAQSRGIIHLDGRGPWRVGGLRLRSASSPEKGNRGGAAGRMQHRLERSVNLFQLLSGSKDIN